MSGVFEPDGSLRFIEGLNLDITERKRQEEELKAAKRAAKQPTGPRANFWPMSAMRSGRR